MSGNGKDFRLRHIFRASSGRCILFAVSHGTSTAKVFRELDDTTERVEAAAGNGADAVLISTGLARTSAAAFRRHPDVGLVVKVSATAFEQPASETSICSTEAAVAAGADGVGIMMQLTPHNETTVLSLVARFGEDCERLGMPYIVEAELPGAYEQHGWAPDDLVTYLRRSCRLAEELGADVIKTNWPGSADAFADVIAPVRKPVLVAGGPRVADTELLQVVDAAIGVGAAGASVGRNIFQSDDPAAATKQIAAVVHDRISPAPA